MIKQKSIMLTFNITYFKKNHSNFENQAIFSF